MSVDEDTELRDLISQTLEENGCFAKIRVCVLINENKFESSSGTQVLI